MRILSALAAVGLLATVPLTSHAQSRPGDDHSTHDHSDKTPADKTQAAPGGMEMKGGATGGMMQGGMMGSDMSRMMAMMHAGMTRGGMMRGGMMGDMPLKHVEGRLAFLKTELKITAAQEPQWAKFADLIRSTAKNAEAAKPAKMQGGMKPSTTPERLANYEKTLAARLETVRALRAAVDPLYTSLSDDQKKVADELLMSPMGMM